jgi:ABC-type antimicrobial peptide transport system permease subunit
MTVRIRPAMLVLMTAVGLVLLIACANVANLLLARGVSRGRELAVRAALGAGRGRLTRQLLTESLAIGVTGGALGVLLAWALTRAVPAWAPAGFPRLEDVRLDLRVLGFAVLVSLVAGALAGLLPALRGSRTDLVPALRADDNRSVGGGSGMRAVLLASEAAMSVMLLIGAALLIRSFVALVNVNPR